MGKQMGLIGWLMVVVCLSFAASSEARQYTVGDGFGWGIPPNKTFYSDWASSKTFFVGDQLVFNWTGTHPQNVLTVGKEDYNNCAIKSNLASKAGSNNCAIKSNLASKAGSPDRVLIIITFFSPGPRYYICTIDDQCARGQKLSIDVK